MDGLALHVTDSPDAAELDTIGKGLIFRGFIVGTSNVDKALCQVINTLGGVPEIPSGLQE